MNQGIETIRSLVRLSGSHDFNRIIDELRADSERITKNLKQPGAQDPYWAGYCAALDELIEIADTARDRLPKLQAAQQQEANFP